MLISLLHVIGYAIIKLFNLLLSGISFVVPDVIEEGIENAINYTSILNILLPISTFWSCVFIYLTAFGFVMIFRLAILVLNALPFVNIGTHHLRK